MATLSAKARNKLPASDFGGPDRSYPMPDRAHAINAKARAAQHASPALKAKIDAKADRVLAEHRADGGACDGMTDRGRATMKTLHKRHGGCV